MLNFFFFLDLTFMCVDVLPVSMSVHHMCALYPQRSEEKVRCPGTGFTGDCEPPC